MILLNFPQKNRENGILVHTFLACKQGVYSLQALLDKGEWFFTNESNDTTFLKLYIF